MKKFKFVIFIAALLLPLSLSAQTGVSLETEIQNTEKLAGTSGISVLERHDALVRLAYLRQLSGDIEGAARNWLEAAAAVPGQVDDDALLSCAYCLAAMGEWTRACIALEPLLSKFPRARFLSIGINALNTGSVSALGEIADDIEYSQMKSEIYYLLWKLSAPSESEKWRQLLVSEFPQSPEGRLAETFAEGAAGESSQSIILRPNPFWLFFGGLDSLPLAAVETVQNDSQTAVSVQVNVQTEDSSGVKLQTGLYSIEVNAQSQADSLMLAGYSPSIEKRITGSGEMWAVTVPAGADTNRTIRELREKGFDSFPLR